jgi:hypothetical protein
MTKTKTKKPAAKSSPRKSKAKAAPKAEKKPKLPFEWRVLRAAFDLIEEEGWAAFSLEDLVGYARLDPDELFALVSRKSDLLVLLIGQIDQAMMEGGLVGGPVRDCLFDLIMRRFEALQPWRAGVVTIVDELGSDPALPLLLLPSFHTSLTLVLESAGLAPTPLRVFGLGAVVLASFKHWLRDDSSDLSSTMAVLDKNLARIEELAESLALVGA